MTESIEDRLTRGLQQYAASRTFAMAPWSELGVERDPQPGQRRVSTRFLAAVAAVVLIAATAAAVVLTRSDRGSVGVEAGGSSGRRSQTTPLTDIPADGTCHLASRERETVLQWGNSTDQRLAVTTSPTNYDLDLFTDGQNAHGTVLDPRYWTEFVGGTKVSWVELLATPDAVVLYGAAPTGTTRINLEPAAQAAGSIIRDTKPVIVDERCGFTVFAVAFSPSAALESATAVNDAGTVLATATLNSGVSPSGPYGGAVLPVSLSPGASMLRTPASQPVTAAPKATDAKPPALGTKVVVAEGPSGSGTWTVSAYRSATGLCVELRLGTSTSGNCGTHSPQSLNVGLSGFMDDDWAFGSAPPGTALVRVEYSDGTSVEMIPTTSNAEFGMSFFAAEVDRDRVIVRAAALDGNGTVIAEQSIPALPIRPSTTDRAGLERTPTS